MLTAVFIPGNVPILKALTTPIAAEAIKRGFKLYCSPTGDGVLLPPDREPAAGWVPGSVHVPADLQVAA